MLLNLHKRGWTEGLKLRDFSEMKEGNEKAVTVSLLLYSMHHSCGRTAFSTVPSEEDFDALQTKKGQVC